MLILTIIIPTIIYVGKNIIQQPTETAEIEKQEESEEEKISAETVTVNAGDSYTVPKDGIYKIELHGGTTEDFKITDDTIISGSKGSKVTGYKRLKKGTLLSAVKYLGGGQDKVPDAEVYPAIPGGANGVGVVADRVIFGVCFSEHLGFRLMERDSFVSMGILRLCQIMCINNMTLVCRKDLMKNRRVLLCTLVKPLRRNVRGLVILKGCGGSLD